MAPGRLAASGALATLLLAAAAVQHSHRGVEQGLLSLGLLSGVVILRGLVRPRENDPRDTRSKILCGLAAAGALAVHPVPAAVSPGLAVSLVAVRLAPRLRRLLRSFLAWPRARQRRRLRGVCLAVVLACVDLAARAAFAGRP